MGQSASRSTPTPPSDPRSTPPSQSSLPASLSSIRSHADQPRNPSPSSAPSHRPSTLNRTLRHLLPLPRSTHSSPHPSPSIRKRWRSSRRFSKQPSPLPNLPNSVSDEHTNPPTSVPQPDLPCHSQIATPPLRQPSSPSSSIHRTQSLPLPQFTDISDAPSLEHPSPAQSQPQHPDFNPPHRDRPQSPIHDSESTHSPCQAGDQVNDLSSDPKFDPCFVQGSSQDSQRSTPPLSSESHPHSLPSDPHPDRPPDSQPQLPRHFQSPGPLVVVQGVVNTSDNPAVTQTSSNSRSSRPSSTTHTPSFLPPISRRRSFSSRTDIQSEERQTTRRRLSALIPRPSSMIGRRPSTPNPASLPPRDSPSGYGSELSQTASPETLVSQDDVSTSSEQESRSSNETDHRRRPLSPGSVDVLGTLLSVAAAATAASLFSPSLGFQAPADTNPPSLPNIPRPMSPTPTAGLGGGQGFGNLPGFELDPSASVSPSPTTTQHREGRERVRGVWESIRERLGLRTPSASPMSDETPSSSEGQGPMRPGEIMLAEMARALNIGLGLNADDSNAEPSEMVASSMNDEGPHSSEDLVAQRPLPPEDSFERFLLNLQADLRTTLLDDGGGSMPMASVENGLVEERASRDSDDGAGSHQPLHEALPVDMVEEDDDEEEEEGEEEPPPLEEVSDSDDDEDMYRVQESARTATPMPSAYSIPSSRLEQLPFGGASGDENNNVNRGQPGINLWRLYRFQPIPATQVAGHASNTTSPASPLSPTPSNASSPPATPPQSPPSPESLPSSLSSTLPIANSDSVDAVPATVTPTGDGTSSMVVPVIVVGLQSVDMGQVQGHGHVHPDPQMRHPSLHSNGRPTSLDSSGIAVPVDGASATPTRGRSWQSRAATALRNLRPGRRNGSSGRQASDSIGSRTFLIYVIGGYYPPNHHMVTGSDNLDSYEALWELAELLGQVKPPVATREEIDRSGLQIINSTELARFEQQGEVASNCVERCLICLDDYSRDEDLRLMSCKHVFHKDCVDKWLQVGRNNCPACRTKGVSTAGDMI